MQLLPQPCGNFQRHKTDVHHGPSAPDVGDNAGHIWYAYMLSLSTWVAWCPRIAATDYTEACRKNCCASQKYTCRGQLIDIRQCANSQCVEAFRKIVVHKMDSLSAFSHPMHTCGAILHL